MREEGGRKEGGKEGRKGARGMIVGTEEVREAGGRRTEEEEGEVEESCTFLR